MDSISQSSPEVSKPKRAEAFEKKELLRYWKEFTEDRRKEGKQQQFLILSQDPVMVDELTIQIKVNSSVQIDTVDQLKSDLLPFLRDKLQNDGLKLAAELEMDESKPLYILLQRNSSIWRKNILRLRYYKRNWDSIQTFSGYQSNIQQLILKISKDCIK